MYAKSCTLNVRLTRPVDAIIDLVDPYEKRRGVVPCLASVSIVIASNENREGGWEGSLTRSIVNLVVFSLMGIIVGSCLIDRWCFVEKRRAIIL